MEGVYEGEYNEAGQKEGYGTLRYADGDVYEGQWYNDTCRAPLSYLASIASGRCVGYEGEWKADKQEGRGTYRHADGAVDVSFYKAGDPVGEGVYWTADGQKACRMRDGTPVKPKLSLEEARRVVAEHGLPLPEGK